MSRVEHGAPLAPAHDPLVVTLVGLVLAVDREAHRRANVEPPTAELRARLDSLLPAEPQARPP